MHCADHCWPGRACDSCCHWFCYLSLTKQIRKPTQEALSHVIDLRIQTGPRLQDGRFAIQCCHKLLAFPEPQEEPWGGRKEHRQGEDQCLPFPLEAEPQKACSSQEAALLRMFPLCPPSPCRPRSPHSRVSLPFRPNLPFLPACPFFSVFCWQEEKCGCPKENCLVSVLSSCCPILRWGKRSCSYQALISLSSQLSSVCFWSSQHSSEPGSFTPYASSNTLITEDCCRCCCLNSPRGTGLEFHPH